MECPDDNTLVALIEHALDPASLSQLEAHVDSCDQCRNVVAGLAAGSARSFAFGTPAPRTRDSAEHLLDTTIDGRYEVRAQLGRGGMGTVYLAHDVTLGRDVAIKLHRAGTGNDRLHREAIAMAKLAHPNVVTVFEVGSVDDRLYVAMELVRGGTLRSWLDGKRDWRAIIALLVEVGGGLAAAHAAGLVHRDFKPENVLVADDGRPRVSDFGLAHLGPETMDRVIAPLASVETRVPAKGGPSDQGVGHPCFAADGRSVVCPRVTVTGTVLGTPAYMAPEQFDGTVDARSDQFAFCVVAWECLFGARPFAGASMAEIQTAIERAEIRRPAKTDVPDRVRRAIERGLAVDPEARYADMRALLAALRVAAAPRLRRRLAWAGAAAVVVAGAVTWGALALRARNAEAACVERGDAVRAIFGADVRAAIGRAFAATGSPSAPASFDRVADVVSRYTNALADRTTAVCRGTDDPPRIAEARTTCVSERVTRLTAFVGDLAATHDASGVQRAPDRAWGLYDPAPCDDVVAAAPAPARTKQDADALDRVQVLLHTGKYAEGITAVDPVLASARAKHDRALEIAALLQLGQLQSEQNEVDAAAKTFRDVEALAESEGHDLEAAMALHKLAFIAGVDRREYPAAHQLIALAKAKLQRLGGRNLALNADLLAVEAQVLADEAKLADAERAIRRAIELAEQAYGADNPKVGTTYGVLSEILRDAGKRPEAVEAARRTLAIFTRALGDQHPTTAGAGMNLATLLTMTGHLDEARELLRRGDVVFLRVWGPDHPARAAIYGNLADVELGQKNFDAALADARTALAILERTRGPESADAAGAHRDIARVLVAQGKLADALVDSQKDVAVLEAHGGKGNPRLASAQIQLAEIQLALRHPALALPIAERGLANELAQGADAEPGELAAGRFALARALWDGGGDRARARSLAEQAAAVDDASKRTEIDAWLTSHSLAQARR